MNSIGLAKTIGIIDTVKAYVILTRPDGKSEGKREGRNYKACIQGEHPNAKNYSKLT